jgi:hypothetical protein
VSALLDVAQLSRSVLDHSGELLYVRQRDAMWYLRPRSNAVGPAMIVQSRFITKNLLGKWVLTKKDLIGKIVAAVPEENAVGVLFEIRTTFHEIWFIRLDELLGSRIVDSEAEAVAAYESAVFAAKEEGT